MGMIPGSGRYPGEGNGNPLQCTCLENSMVRGAWQASVHGVARVRHDLVAKPIPSIACRARGRSSQEENILRSHVFHTRVFGFNLAGIEKS